MVFKFVISGLTLLIILAIKRLDSSQNKVSTMSSKGFIYMSAIFLALFVSYNNASASPKRSFTIFAKPQVQICTGCPSHFCDDDPAIIHGYCCGCANVFDNFPVQCSPFLRCPINLYELCQRFDYMKYCCCSK